MEEVIIIGVGAAGLSAAIELAKNGVKSILVADMPSERAQSVMAEGGINAAFPSDTDSPELHAEETLRAGRYLADPTAVHNLAKNASKMIEELFADGMSFTLNHEGKPDVRAFGGQSVKRTFYAASNTGRQLMHTLIAQVRRYESENTIRRLTGWLFKCLLWNEDQVCGCILINAMHHEQTVLHGKVIIASGGMNGIFGNATGSVRNTGAVIASLFADGVAVANGEFIQYHPTTVPLPGKNMLITEAVRGEGGRLFTLQKGKPYYFMEEKYPELGNLMPRDVIAQEEWALIQQGQQVWLDMRHLDKKVQQNKLRGVVDDCRQFLGIDPTKKPIPVMPGIHYFMGGILVDCQHRTYHKGLYAAGECACQYHGANRLGGNSLLGAMYGGKTAARSAMADSFDMPSMSAPKENKQSVGSDKLCYVDEMENLHRMMQNGLGIIRNSETIQTALYELKILYECAAKNYDPSASAYENEMLKNCCLLGQGLLMSADSRKESRGAHTRSDFPKERSAYQKKTIAQYANENIKITYESVGDNHAH